MRLAGERHRGCGGILYRGQYLNLYVASGYVFDDFERFPWELGGGAAVYPFANRSWRLTLHVMHVDKSPTGSNFGYYAAGQTGTILSIGTDFIL